MLRGIKFIVIVFIASNIGAVVINRYMASEEYGWPMNRNTSSHKSDRQVNQGDVGFWKIDEYGDITPKEERRRLQEFARRMKMKPAAHAYIVAYGGRRSWKDEAKQRACCVKDYLAKRGIGTQRIVTVDGGYRDEAMISLYEALPHLELPSLSPTVESGDIQINAPPSRYQRGQCPLLSGGRN